MDPLTKRIAARTGLDPRVIQHALEPRERHPNGRPHGTSDLTKTRIRRALQAIQQEASRAR